jgi:hypothetical protein
MLPVSDQRSRAQAREDDVLDGGIDAPWIERAPPSRNRSSRAPPGLRLGSGIRRIRHGHSQPARVNDFGTLPGRIY